MTTIYELREGSADVRRVATYALEPQKAMVAYIEQRLNNNYNTWDYPEIIEGMRESDTIADHWYYDLFKGRNAEFNGVLSAYPDNTPIKRYA